MAKYDREGERQGSLTDKAKQGKTPNTQLTHGIAMA